MDDDDDDREFSRSIVFGFFEQAESTFDKMENDLCVNSLIIPYDYTQLARASCA
jgi:osomolarity two-component system phosphorelay intermediate protein YPD1